MTDITAHIVGAGEWKMETGAGFLAATLGSCLGIAVLWKKAGRYGLAHCLLPQAPNSAAGQDARYVDEALPSLLSCMGVSRQDYPDIEIVIAGGARLQTTRAGTGIGKLNTEAARRTLLLHGLTVTRRETGGRRRRRILVDCQGARVVITDIVARQAEHKHACG